MSKSVIGLDIGTHSCRSLLVDVNIGKELTSAVFNYPSGKEGVIVDETDPNLARQNPSDYLIGIERTIKTALANAKDVDKDFNVDDVIGIGVDTTGSSPMPVDENGFPLCFDERFEDNPASYVWLWKDHTSFEEAALITETARRLRPAYLAKIGGVYSSEWFWSKILHCKNVAPEVYNSAFSFVEICDWITAHLVGELNPTKIKRSVCAAGHKAMFNNEWNGLPDKEFLNILSAGLGELRDRLYSRAYSSEELFGYL